MKYPPDFFADKYARQSKARFFNYNFQIFKIFKNAGFVLEFNSITNLFKKYG